MNHSKTSVIYLTWIQGGYFFLSGIWPLIHISSFIFVTGPKTDLWLVKTVGIMIVSLSIGMLIAAFKKEIPDAIIASAIFSALGLSIIDIYYSLKNIISPIYLFDSFIELFIVFSWIFVLRKK